MAFQKTSPSACPPWNAEKRTGATSSVRPDGEPPGHLAVRDRVSKPDRGTRKCQEKFPARPALCFAMDCSTVTPLFQKFQSFRFQVSKTSSTLKLESRYAQVTSVPHESFVR